MKIKKLLISLSTPIIASMSLMPLVSCGQTEVKPTVDTDEHVGEYEVSKIYLNKDFTVKLSKPKSYYEKLSKDNTRVTIGNTIVTPEWSDDCKSFKIKGSDVNNQQIEIYLSAEATFHDFVYEWHKKLPLSQDKIMRVYHPGETIKATTGKGTLEHDFNIWVLFGDEDESAPYFGWKLLKPGTGTNEVRVEKRAYGSSEWVDQTAEFAANGYTFQDSDVRSNTQGDRFPTVQNFRFTFIENGSSHVIEFNAQDGSCLCALPITTFTATAEKTTLSTNESTNVSAKVNSGAMDAFELSIDASSPLQAPDIIVDGVKITATNKTGTAIINVTASDDRSFTQQITITIA